MRCLAFNRREAATGLCLNNCSKSSALSCHCPRTLKLMVLWCFGSHVAKSYWSMPGMCINSGATSLPQPAPAKGNLLRCCIRCFHGLGWLWATHAVCASVGRDVEVVLDVVQSGVV